MLTPYDSKRHTGLSGIRACDPRMLVFVFFFFCGQHLNSEVLSWFFFTNIRINYHWIIITHVPMKTFCINFLGSWFGL